MSSFLLNCLLYEIHYIYIVVCCNINFIFFFGHINVQQTDALSKEKRSSQIKLIGIVIAKFCERHLMIQKIKYLSWTKYHNNE